MNDREERIRRRAYALWEQEGCPEDRAHYHWELAADLIDREDANGLPGKSFGPPPETDPDPAQVPEKYYADQGDLPDVKGQIQISQGTRKQGQDKRRNRGSGTTKPDKGSQGL
ncbi:DUF2934 domain-containing protein [Fodinicurvata sp. EGI_FJ10296]|uniref:DUF2934 domain-containing protein n=1 Tax=Fodinicurvata sp. EGI_FJ10296 TaxID=3231908 RepID=UPI0034566C57